MTLKIWRIIDLINWTESYFKEKGDNLKLDLIKDLNDGEISFYKQGNFTDLCKGPHIPSSKFIKSFKILNTAGAYWRGDENNKQLTRLYAVSFPKLNMLEEHLIKWLLMYFFLMVQEEF